MGILLYWPLLNRLKGMPDLHKLFFHGKKPTYCSPNDTENPIICQEYTISLIKIKDF